MKTGQAINMAICAVTMDRMLDMKTKQEIHEALAETERLADIGRATEKIFFKGGWIQMMHIKDIDTTDKLLEWAKGGK